MRPIEKAPRGGRIAPIAIALVTLVVSGRLGQAAAMHKKLAWQLSGTRDDAGTAINNYRATYKRALSGAWDPSGTFWRANLSANMLTWGAQLTVALSPAEQTPVFAQADYKTLSMFDWGTGKRDLQALEAAFAAAGLQPQVVGLKTVHGINFA